VQEFKYMGIILGIAILGCLIFGGLIFTIKVIIIGWLLLFVWSLFNQ